MKTRYHFYLTFLLIAGLLLSGLVTGCRSESTTTTPHNHAMAAMEGMPASVQQAPVRVQEAYQFAVANPAALANIPCYCGCGPMGHTSNYSCYVSGETDRELVFDEHALGCGICVDITQDVMRLQDQGKTADEIFAVVDSTYAQFGPPTPLQ